MVFTFSCFSPTEGLMGRRSQASRFQRLSRLLAGPLPGLTVRYARRYVAVYPEHGHAWVMLGTALVGLGRYEDAHQALEKGIDLCPPESRRVPLAEMGHLFLEAGDYDQAAAWYRQAIDADPSHASGHIYLGAVLAKQGRLHEAADAHRAATGCVRGCIAEAYLNLGLVLRALERFREAGECFREALRRNPRDRLARRALRDVERCVSSARELGD
jgi:tetratricopeptide (TPR) repeat protein